jgi:hypothetical protein
VAWAKTGIAIAENNGGEQILAEWKAAIENGAPTNLVIRRSVFVFAEGYSPLPMFRRDHEDVMCTYLRLSRRRPADRQEGARGSVCSVGVRVAAL